MPLKLVTRPDLETVTVQETYVGFQALSAENFR